ncbi:MAG: aminotransferase class III-fold pyridoxal phosphate-dependent enzyme [Clostridia bacterium]|nr:aminotransferase class III-fold pyridoxal phosphate-dependent enzyme [Clostridia bacterium]
MSATGQPGSAIHKGFEPLLPGFKYVEYNNLKAWEEAITPNTIAFMLEPVQGEGGVIPAKPEFLKGLRDLADKNNMLLCFDEVQTGWGRTGSIMAFMGYGVKPDIVSMAKAMGNGVAIGAIGATAKVAAAFGAGAHGSTFGGSILNCAGSYAAVTTIVGEKLYENAGVMGDYLAGLFAKMPHVKEVRHRGLLVGVEFDAPKGLDIKHGCVDQKMLVTAIGTSVIRVIPPLVITKADCEECAKRMTLAIKEAYGE